MKFGSLFSGVGGFDLALEQAGMTCAWQVEIEPQALNVLRYHWPGVVKHEDVRAVGAANLAPVDLICGGFPCQDLSVAGRRGGLAGERSGLFYEFARIIGELAPEWVLLENVPGLLSSNRGRDMGAVLGALGELGYGYAYRVLDSQYCGVPQRRERVFIVGRARGVCPAEVLFEPESLPGNHPPSREAGARVACAIASSPQGGSGYRNDADTAENLIARALTQGGSIDGETETVIPIQEIGKRTGSGGEGQNGCGIGSPGDPMFALQSSAQHGIAHTLRAEGFDASEDGPLIPFDTTQITSAQNRSQPKSGDPMHPLPAHGHAPAIAFNATQDPISGEIAGALSDQGAAVANRWGVRRLTPTECEHLQGLPDRWTRYGITAKDKSVELKDGPRYRALGNAVTVPVVEWIARRIALLTSPANVSKICP